MGELKGGYVKFCVSMGSSGNFSLIIDKTIRLFPSSMRKTKSVDERKKRRKEKKERKRKKKKKGEGKEKGIDE